MKIRVGFEFTYEFVASTPMVLMLNVHPSRATDLIKPDQLRTTPMLPLTRYADAFGNICTRLLAPKGELQLSTDALVADTGLPDVVEPAARQYEVAELPHETLVFLLGSRYCETERLMNEAWSRFGKTPTGWPRVQAICDFVQSHVRFGYPHARPTRTAAEVAIERRGVCRDFAHLAVTLCRCMNIPARYCTGYGFQRLVRGLSRRPLVHLRCPPQHAAHRPDRDGARPRRRRRRDQHHVRPECAQAFLRADRRGDGGAGAARAEEPQGGVRRPTGAAPSNQTARRS
jgi:transglutaminase-like putative cysteine protease